MSKTPKDWEDFITNHWPHLVATVASNTKLLYLILGALVAGFVARSIF